MEWLQKLTEAGPYEARQLPIRPDDIEFEGAVHSGTPPALPVACLVNAAEEIYDGPRALMVLATLGADHLL